MTANNAPKSDQRLPAKRRLKHRKTIDALFTGGHKVSVGAYRVFYTSSPAEEGGVLWGVGVSKKKFSKAVDRNLVKRRTREACRRQQESITSLAREKQVQLALFFVYQYNTAGSVEECATAVAAALAKIRQRLTSPQKPTS